MQQGLCCHPAHLWANSTPPPRFEALGIPQAAVGPFGFSPPLHPLL